MFDERLQAGIDCRDDVLVRNLYEHIESETYSSYGAAFQILRARQRRATNYSTTRTLALRNVFTSMS
jgi:hypothetical protein